MGKRRLNACKHVNVVIFSVHPSFPCYIYASYIDSRYNRHSSHRWFYGGAQCSHAPNLQLFLRHISEIQPWKYHIRGSFGVHLE